MKPFIDTGELWVLSYYRASELAGALLFGRLARRTRDAELGSLLTRHFAEEARHAWEWTDAIHRLGELPIPITETYQSRYAREIGVPTAMEDILLLTRIFEERIRHHFTIHAQRPGLHPIIRQTLEQMLADEERHLDWIGQKLASCQAAAPDRLDALMEAYRAADERIYQEVMPYEKRLWDFLGVVRVNGKPA